MRSTVHIFFFLRNDIKIHFSLKVGIFCLRYSHCVNVGSWKRFAGIHRLEIYLIVNGNDEHPCNLGNPQRIQCGPWTCYFYVCLSFSLSVSLSLSILCLQFVVFLQHQHIFCVHITLKQNYVHHARRIFFFSTVFRISSFYTIVIWFCLCLKKWISCNSIISLYMNIFKENVTNN